MTLVIKQLIDLKYELSLAHKDIREGPWNLPNVEGASEILISLPPPFGNCSA